MPQSEFRPLAPHNRAKMVCCGAGVSPAILRCVEIAKNTGETPAPQEAALLHEVDELHFVFDPVAKLACRAYAMIRLEIQREF
jgi:hypothetical protein